MSQTSIPFIELHRHLSGSIRPRTILELGQQHNIPLPANSLDELIPHVQIVEILPDLISFLAKIKLASTVIADYDACRRIAYEAVEDAANEGIDYLELRFSAQFLANPFSLSQVGVAEAVIDGALSASRDRDIKINLIGVLSRTLGPEACMDAVDALMAVKDKIVALDLAGDEKNWPGRLFVDHFRKGRDAGWQITVHAGEAAGSENVRQAINEMGATRIGHATNAIHDPALMDDMAERGIGIESNLTSNVHTSTVNDLASHPLRHFLKRGILATINTDDPQISDIDLPFEYTTAAPAAGLTPEQIAQARQNALAIAFLTDGEKSALVEAAAEVRNQ